MARIRSVHPGLFTDEAFMNLSCDAQIFLIGLWVEADDQGVFDWKPGTLRARIRPTKDGDISILLSELADANCIRKYEIEGKQFGAIRNFRKFQRPKTPNATHLTTAEIRKYVGLSETISEIAGADELPFPQKAEINQDDNTPFLLKAEKSPQMKEEGGSKKEISPPSEAHPPDTQIVIDLWNAMAERTGLAKVQRLTQQRASLISARLRDAGGLAGVRAALEKVERSSFLTGQRQAAAGHENWRCSFDFFLKAQSFTKIMEGQYDDRDAANGPRSAGGGSAVRQAMAGAFLARGMAANGAAAGQPSADSGGNRGSGPSAGARLAGSSDGAADGNTGALRPAEEPAGRSEILPRGGGGRAAGHPANGAEAGPPELPLVPEAGRTQGSDERGAVRAGEGEAAPAHGARAVPVSDPLDIPPFLRRARAAAT